MKLIIINGPAGIGKSTAAKNVHASLPLAHLVDIDALRRCISGYKENREESNRIALQITEAIIEASLQDRRDVVVEKYISKAEVVDRFIALGVTYGASVTEVILTASKDLVTSRAAERGYTEGGTLTPEKVEAFWEAMETFRKERKNAIVIDVESLSEEEVYKRIIDIA